MKNDRLYLVHILECVENIRSYTCDGRNAFLTDPKTRDAVLRNLHTLAESTQRLSKELQAKYPQVPWKNIFAFRNVVVHDYLGIDVNLIWDIVEKDLPDLKPLIEKILRELE